MKTRRIISSIIFTAVITAAVLALVGCEEFTTSYRRIDATELRMLNFMYQPADAAPGDSVTFMAVFAGKSPPDGRSLYEYIDWQISFNVIRDVFGAETVVDSMPMMSKEVGARVFDTSFSENTQTVAFRFKIPEDIVKTSASIPERWTDMLPGYMRDAIPAEYASIPKSPHVDMLTSADPALVAGNPYLPILLQLFTVPYRVTAKINEEGRLPHTIRSSQTVRYNRRFHSRGFYNIPINRNTAVDSIVLYKIKGKNVATFDPNSGAEESSVRLDNSNDLAIEVTGGYTYFIHAATAGSIDFTISMDGNRLEEKHYAYWQFRLDDEEVKGVHHSDYMDFESDIGNIWTLKPPKNQKIERFTFWVTVRDEVINERLRPIGSSLTEVSGRFVYK